MDRPDPRRGTPAGPPRWLLVLLAAGTSRLLALRLPPVRRPPRS
ncbi:hypothetical protein [Modestobacter excelsi]|nr:hypothetical protein [Modestobacter excelsi]